MYLVGQHFNHLWNNVIATLLGINKEQASRAGDTREVIGASLYLETALSGLLTHPGRNMSLHYAGAELIWYLSGTADIEMLTAYAPSYTRFVQGPMDDKIHAYGAYGPRILHAVKDLIEILESNPESRQAIVGIWQSRDLAGARMKGFGDIPCTLSLQYLVRGGAVHCITTMRSNDVWLGLPYDVFCFTAIQAMVATDLGYKVGSYTHNVGSLHLYAKNFEKAYDARKVEYPRDIGYFGVAGSQGSFLKSAEWAVEAERQCRTSHGYQLPKFHDNLLGTPLEAAVIFTCLKWVEDNSARKELKSRLDPQIVEFIKD